MTRKHRKQIRKLEKMASPDIDINDLCPLIYRCKEPWCYDKFGQYKKCKRYKTNNPRVDSNDPHYHVDGWKE